MTHVVFESNLDGVFAFFKYDACNGVPFDFSIVGVNDINQIIRLLAACDKFNLSFDNISWTIDYNVVCDRISFRLGDNPELYG